MMAPARILLVEDNTAARMTLVEGLDTAGYDVTSVSDGETALTLLAQTLTTAPTFDLVITDIYLHAVSGIDVMHAALAQQHGPSVILLTGAGAIETAITALRAGASDYVLKPITPDHLRASVATALNRRRETARAKDALETIAEGLNKLHSIAKGKIDDDAASEAPAQSTKLQIGQAEFDTERHTVRWSGKALHVTPIEYALLRCLAQAPNRVWAYDAIVQRTHNLSLTNQEAKQLLKSHVRNLRRKLGHGYIVNVDGSGYMLVPNGGALEQLYG